MDRNNWFAYTAEHVSAHYILPINVWPVETHVRNDPVNWRDLWGWQLLQMANLQSLLMALLWMVHHIRLMFLITSEDIINVEVELTKLNSFDVFINTGEPVETTSHNINLEACNG